VLELPAGGGTQVSTPVNAPGHGNNLNGLAVDGKGDVFIGNVESGVFLSCRWAEIRSQFHLTV
jgi:hypothetical protein